MTLRIIETASGIAARQPGISQLPPGVYYTDPVYGLVVDYITETAPDELVLLTLYACRQASDGTFDVLKPAPADFTACHDFAGWPAIHAEPVQG